MTLLSYMYIYIEQNERINMKDAYKLYETRGFEKIWQNTVSQQIQSGVVFYNQIQGVISVNQKFREIVGIPNNSHSLPEKEIISKEQQQLQKKNQKSSFEGYQFPRQDSMVIQVNLDPNQQQNQDELNTSYSQKIQENLLNLSQYFNQHLHWDTNKSLSSLIINGQNANKNRKFRLNKFNFYAFNKNNKQEDNDNFNEDIDWSLILVKPKQVKLQNDKTSDDQPSQQNDQLRNQPPENQSQKTLAGNITVNSINRDQQNNQELQQSSNLQTPNFGNKLIQKTQLIKNNLMNFDEQQSSVKVKIRIPILEIFYELSQKCLEQYKINQMIQQEQKNKKEQNNMYNQVQNDQMKSQVSCVSECYKVIKTKNIIRIITQAYLIRGRAYYIFSIEGDIRAKQELQNQMETRKQDLLQLASILHDLKTPLNCISGTSQILRAFVESDQPALMPYLKNFDLSLEFIFAMIEDIQDLAKFSGSQNFSLTNEFFEVRGFLKDVLVLFEQQCAFKSIDLKRFVDDNVPTKIYSDQKRIKQILMNMISNALKFTTKGFIMVSFSLLDDEIEISNELLNNVSDVQQEIKSDQNLSSSINENTKKFETQNVSKDKQSEVNIHSSVQDQSMLGENQANLKQKIKKRMKIVIEDTGLGIKKDDLQKLFKYFGKLKDKKKINQKGTGLGLNISRRIVEAMGGTIEVESEYKQGTKFTMIVNIQVKQGDQFQIKKALTEYSDHNMIQGSQKQLNIPQLKQSEQNLAKKPVLKINNQIKLSTIVEENLINTPQNQYEFNQDLKEKNERLQNQNQENFNKKRRQSRPQNDQRNFNQLRNEQNKQENVKFEEMGSQKISSYNISIQSEITSKDQKLSEYIQSNSNFHNSKDKDDSQFKKKQNKKQSTFAAGYKMGKIQPKQSDRNVSQKLQEIQQYFTKPINELNTSKNLFSQEYFQTETKECKDKAISEEDAVQKRSNQQEEEKIEIKKLDRLLKGESGQSDIKRQFAKKGKKKRLNMIRSNDSKAIKFPLLVQNSEAAEKIKTRAKSIASNVFKFRNRLSKEQSQISTEDSKFKEEFKVNFVLEKEPAQKQVSRHQSYKSNPKSKQSSKKITTSDDNLQKRNDQITKNATS